MSPAGVIAQVWPNAEALRAEQRRRTRDSPGGLLLGGSQLFTFGGVNGLLSRLWGQLPSEQRQGQVLAEMAGPLLVQNILDAKAFEQPLLAGLGRGRRFPHRLWRLLVGLRSAGLTPSDLQDLEGPGQQRRQALARLLTDYTEGLSSLGLWDEADQLAALESHLALGKALPVMASWSGLRVKQALWLRPADLRLLRALARQVSVEVEFALTPPVGAGQGVFNLLEVTARALESDPAQQVAVSWRDLETEGGPLAKLSLLEWSPQASYRPSGEEPLELLRCAGRYAEVEALLRRAQDLIEDGVAPHDIALVFPNLQLYGQMAGDVAGRLGLPLSFRRADPLASAPLVQDFAGLLALPRLGYPRQELARVWDSPYLGPALARLLEVSLPRRAGAQLARAGYVDARETPVSDWLARQEGGGGEIASLRELARSCRALTAWLAPLDSAQTLAEYAGRVERMLERLALTDFLRHGLDPGPWPAQVLARDLNSLEGLKGSLAQVSAAAGQIGGQARLNPGRLQGLLLDAWQQSEINDPVGVRGGIKVLRLEDAQGHAPQFLLAGGLSQEEFPQKPQDLHLLSSNERIALGRRVGLPVWRTEEEEYGGQTLRLLLLLASAGHGAALSCPASNPSGAPSQPSLLLSRLAAALGQTEQLAQPQGSLYGELPDLEECRDAASLWGGLARTLLRSGANSDPQAGLAQGALSILCSDHALARNWQDLAGRSQMEEQRLRLEALPAQERLEEAGPFDGLLSKGPCLELLADILAAPRMRRLSPSSLEAYAACPMSWFLNKLLGLREPLAPDWDLERREEGRWVHRVLAAFFKPDEFDPAWDQEQMQERLARCLAREGRKTPGHQVVRRARERVLSFGLARVVAREMTDMAGLRPSRVESDFGGEENGLEVPLPGQAPLVLHGILDRLDQRPGQLRVVDYKHSNSASAISGPLKEADLGVSGFQMPVYLAGAREFFGEPRDAMQARLVPTRRPEFKVRTRDWPGDDPFFGKDQGLRQDMAERGQANLYNGLVSLWQRLSQGQFLAQPSAEACGFCPLSGVCRSRENPAARGGGA